MSKSFSNNPITSPSKRKEVKPLYDFQVVFYDGADKIKATRWKEALKIISKKHPDRMICSITAWGKLRQ